ncbi:MAG: hypothetical protein IPG02_18140 [Ignavibacteria bacterium]|nr:hypothetical protein [Ignavibacteria bacterium]
MIWERTVTGIIVSLSHSTHLKKVIPIKFISDKNPVINSELLKFCKWISDYYIAPPGEVLFSCVPRKSNLSSTIKYELAERAARLLTMRDSEAECMRRYSIFS